jgi:hypothetical protein
MATIVGGAAFPRPYSQEPCQVGPDVLEHFAHSGMSLRAYIATEVFAQHEAVEYVTSCSGEDLQRRARTAVAAADALIAALNEESQP